jgi:hypothetical protein
MQVPGPPLELLGDAGGVKDRFYHLGMGQTSPDGQGLMFLHRTARGKYFPWCAARGWVGPECKPAWVTLPVKQEQLTASARDAGSLRFDSDKIDTAWYLQSNNCHYWTATCNVSIAISTDRGSGTSRNNSSGGSEAFVGSDVPPGVKLLMERHINNKAARCSSGSRWAMPLPECDKSYRVGQQLPIPAFAVSAIPGLQGYMAAVDAVFEQLYSILDVSPMDRIRVWCGILHRK